MKFLKLLASIVICEFIGIGGAIFTTPAINSWYKFLQKPWFNPPNWLFGPVWTLLYFLMAISVYLVWQKGFTNHKVKAAIYIFIIQLILNFFWSLLFFGLRNPFLGLVEIVILWFMIILTIFKFWPIRRLAALLLTPYLLWVSFATLLNYSIFKLN